MEGERGWLATWRPAIPVREASQRRCRLSRDLKKEPCKYLRKEHPRLQEQQVARGVRMRGGSESSKDSGELEDNEEEKTFDLSGGTFPRPSGISGSQRVLCEDGENPLNWNSE